MHLNNYNCLLCVEGKEETISTCCLTAILAKRDGYFWDTHWDTDLQPLDMIIQARQGFGSTKFREIIIIAAKAIWCHCHMNSIIFFYGGSFPLVDGVPALSVKW